MMNRRNFLRNMAAMTAIGMTLSEKTLAQSNSGAHVGDSPDAFEAIFGPGRDENGYTVYEGVANDTADYWVLLNAQGVVESVEVDFQYLPGGGLASSTDNIGTSRFIRDDATQIGPTMLVGSLNNWRHSFHIAPWMSESLASDLKRSGIAFVVDEDAGDSGYKPIGDWNILRTNVAMETFNHHEIVRTGELPGPSTTIEGWQSNYDMTVDPKSAFAILNNPPIPGDWRIGTVFNEVDISFSQPISPRESAELIGSMLTVSGNEICTTYIPPSPNGPIALRINRFNLGLKGWPHTVLQYVSGGELNGSVDRIIMRAEPA